MTSTIINDDPLVHYSPSGWEQESRFGGIHAPTVNDPTGARITLEFDGTGVAVVGFLMSSDHDNVQDLLRCAVDTPDIPPPTPLSNAQTSTQLTVCVISPLPSTHHTLRVYPGERADNNPLISGFVVFSDSTNTPVVTTPAPPTQQSGSPSTATKDTSSLPSPTSQPASSEGQTSMMTSSPSTSSPSSLMPTRTSAVSTHSQTSQNATNSPSSHDTPFQSPRHPNTAAISGGIVGGIVLLLLILVVMFYSRRWMRVLGRRSNPAQTAQHTFIATPSDTRRLFTRPPLAEPSSPQAHLTMATMNHTPYGFIPADLEKLEHGVSHTSASMVATDGQRTPSPTGSSGSLGAPSSHTRLVHGEVLSTAWCAPTELQSRAQSLLHGFSTQQGRAPAMRDVDSGLRVYNEPALPPPYTPD